MIEKGFWTILAGAALILSWVGMNISEKLDIMSASVIELNTTMKGVIAQIDDNKKKLNTNDNILNDLENRVLILESKSYKLGE